MNMAANEKTPAPSEADTGARGPEDHCSRNNDSLAALQTQRLARAGIPPHLAAILAPVAFGGGAHG